MIQILMIGAGGLAIWCVGAIALCAGWSISLRGMAR
ncbi:hypothetical protein GGR01_002250 [Acetobacter oeni]|nr:hypothetical protein [Acetobacter oeni]